jgi:Fe-Mn family superoxide dismutase
MKKLECVDFYHDVSALKPAINEIGFDIHFNKVYRQHVTDFNDGIGDFAFNKAGAYLHDLYFDNIREARENNLPTGKSLDVITQRYGTYDNFQKTVREKAATLQGSGWVFMNHAGYVNIIPNNRIVENVALIIDLWEHAYAFAHGANKAAYIEKFFDIINWDKINSRLINA